MAKPEEPRPPEAGKLKVQRGRKRLWELEPEPAVSKAKPAPKKKSTRATGKPAKPAAAITPVAALGSAHDEAARALVRGQAAWAAGVGLIPLPLVDVVAISAIQLSMVKSLAGVYGVEFSEHRAKAYVGTLLGVITPASFLGSFGRALPGSGLLGALLVPGAAGAATYALGRVFMQHFALGGTLLDFDPEETRGYLEEQYAAAKKGRK